MSGGAVIPFGVVFGELVKKRRRELKITQATLAEDVLGDIGRKGDISRLENGKVSNPQPFTVQRLAEYLRLSSAEIDRQSTLARELDDLRRQNGSLAGALARVKQLSKNQLIALAAQFEIEEAASLTTDNLRRLLVAKAEEYRVYRAKIDALDERLAAIANLKIAAKDAADRLDFDEVEALLCRVDEVETEVAADTKLARAANALLINRVSEAYRILSSAADSFASIDPIEPAWRRRHYQDILYRHGLQYGLPGLKYMERMVRDAMAITEVQTDRNLWGWLHINLANSLGDQGEAIVGDRGTHLLARSIRAYDEALKLLKKREEPYLWSAVQNNKGTVLHAYGERSKGKRTISFFKSAIKSYSLALEIRHRDKYADEWAETQNNIGDAYNEIGIRSIGVDSIDAFDKAISTYKTALSVSTRTHNPVHWAIVTQNLSVSLQNIACHVEGNERKKYINAAMDGYLSSLEIRKRNERPVDWAITQTNMAKHEEILSRLADNTKTCQGHLMAALAHADNALSVYGAETSSFEYSRGLELRTRLAASLATLDSR